MFPAPALEFDTSGYLSILEITKRAEEIRPTTRLSG
jgi:hypothetical protein